MAPINPNCIINPCISHVCLFPKAPHTFGVSLGSGKLQKIYTVEFNKSAKLNPANNRTRGFHAMLRRIFPMDLVSFRMDAKIKEDPTIDNPPVIPGAIVTATRCQREYR